MPFYPIQELNRWRSYLALATLLLASCALPSAPAREVTPQQVLKTAASYASHQWIGYTANSLHGTDRLGIEVHTPDQSYQAPEKSTKGWWRVGAINKGIPYKWGGFDTPAEFDQKLMQGFYAGDVYTTEKGRLLDKAVSHYTAGIDCSGFISRCWGLDSAYSTRTLHTICTPLSSYAELRAGDILNKFNEHVVLFVKPLDAERFLAYEAISEPFFRVVMRPLRYEYFREQGYQALRYQKMIRKESPSAEGLVLTDEL